MVRLDVQSDSANRLRVRWQMLTDLEFELIKSTAERVDLNILLSSLAQTNNTN